MLSDLKNKKICIIDDNPAVCDSLRFLFRSILNIEVEVYNRSLEFIDKFSAEWQGCLIVDYFMPVLNGIELIKKLHNNRMGIIIMSGNSTPDMIAKAFAAGAKAFVTKPFQIDYFLGKVKEILSI